MEYSVREKIIALLLQTDNDKLLEQVYSILDSAINSQNGEIWNTLSKAEKQNTILSLEESESTENLVDHDQVMQEVRAKLGWS